MTLPLPEHDHTVHTMDCGFSAQIISLYGRTYIDVELFSSAYRGLN